MWQDSYSILCHRYTVHFHFFHTSIFFFSVVSSNNCTWSGRLGALQSDNVSVCMHSDTPLSRRGVAQSLLHEVSNIAAWFWAGQHWAVHQCVRCQCVICIRDTSKVHGNPWHCPKQIQAEVCVKVADTFFRFLASLLSFFILALVIKLQSVAMQAEC